MIRIEILSRHRDVVERYRVEGEAATVGRAYDNDVVLSDPTVAPHHLRVAALGDGRFEVADLGSANGLVGPDGRRVASGTGDGDAVWRIGHTTLRVRGPSYAVEGERTLAAPAAHGRLAAVLALVVVALALGETWLHQTEDPRATQFVLPLLAVAALVLAWTTGWALVSRIFAGSARFATHLAIALAGLLALDVFGLATGLIDYAVSARPLVELAYAGVWSIVGVTAFVHLRAVGPRHQGAKLAVVTALAVAGVSAQTLLQADFRRSAGEEARATGAWPPSFRIAPPQTAEAFFARVDGIRPLLERARKEPAEADSRWIPFEDE